MKSEAAKISLMHNNAKYWIRLLGLLPHPEGGHFKEVYRSEEEIKNKNLPGRYTGNRPFSTSIYFLLQADEISAFHRLKSDETWYYHDGAELEILVINDAGLLTRNIMGVSSFCQPQITIKQNHWFASHSLGEFTLASCNVAPGFDFEDFEMANISKMVAQYPRYKKVFSEFCIHSL